VAACFGVALAFAAVESRQPELRLLHCCLDSWRDIGDVVTGMKRQGYEVSLGATGGGQWIAIFYQGHGGYGYEALNAAGTAQASTPWGALQRAAWDVVLRLAS